MSGTLERRRGYTQPAVADIVAWFHAEMKKTVGLLVILTGAAAAAGPRYLKRRLAPPQRPVALSPTDLDLVGEQVWLTSHSGTRLHGWHIPADGPAPGVVVVHGWGANASLMLPFAPHLREAGYHSFFLDARNHGLSEHDDFSSMPRFAEDLGVALDWLRQRPEVTALAAVGHSVGAGAVVMACSDRDDIAAAVAISAFSHPVEIMLDQTWIGDRAQPVQRAIIGYMGRVLGYDFDEISPRHRIRRVTTPLLLVHGSLDPVVPVGNAYELAGLGDAELVVLSDVAHSDLDHFMPHVGLLTDFLDRHLRSEGDQKVGANRA